MIDPTEAKAIELFGKVVDPDENFWPTRAGFQLYLNAVGVKRFSAAEMTTPHQRDLAMKLGYGLLLPPKDWWPRGAMLALLADMIREHLGEPVHMRNWWRPSDYNKAVGGAKRSDHVTAHAVDLDYKSADSRRLAVKLLDQLDNDEPWLAMSVGLGGRMTHVGLLSPGGRRRWKYRGYTP